MFPWCKPRKTKVGYLIDTNEAGIIWFDPEPLQIKGVSKSIDSKLRCPAVHRSTKNIYLIRAPFDFNYLAGVGPNGQLALQSPYSPENSPISPQKLSQMLAITPSHAWADPMIPTFQIMTPYTFVSDTPGVTVRQTPPYMHYTGLPGQIVSGEVDAYAWAGRHLTWAFELHDASRPIIFKRGDPWFYVEIDGPGKIELFECRKTPELERQIARIAGVSQYVKQTASLFAIAGRKRAKKLLER